MTVSTWARRGTAWCGSGATFEFLWFSAIRDESEIYGDRYRDTIVSGGLGVGF